MALKMVIFYEQAARGWTETYYASGSNPSVFSSQFVNSNNLAPFVNIRANDVFITEVRVSLIGSPRVTYSTPFLLASNLSFNDTEGTYNQDTYGEDALILVRSAGGIPRHIWLRGLPNVFIKYDQDGRPAAPSQFLVAMQAIEQSIIAMGLQVQNANIPPPSSPLWFNVAYVMAGATGGQPNSSLNCPTIPTLTQPYPPLYFNGIPRNLLPGFPRIITPGVVTPGIPPALNQIFVPYLYRGPTAEVYPPKMKFCVLAYTYNTITSLAFATYGTRKTGRPSGLPRGRASVVIRRQ